MIKDTFKKYGDNFFLMSIVGEFYVYRREKPTTGELQGYEIMKPIKMNGELVLPSASFWGIYGWTLQTEVAVVNKLDELTNK